MSLLYYLILNVAPRMVLALPLTFGLSLLAQEGSFPSYMHLNKQRAAAIIGIVAVCMIAAAVTRVGRPFARDLVLGIMLLVMLPNELGQLAREFWGAPLALNAKRPAPVIVPAGPSVAEQRAAQRARWSKVRRGKPLGVWEGMVVLRKAFDCVRQSRRDTEVKAADSVIVSSTSACSDSWLYQEREDPYRAARRYGDYDTGWRWRYTPLLDDAGRVAAYQIIVRPDSMTGMPGPQFASTGSGVFVWRPDPAEEWKSVPTIAKLLRRLQECLANTRPAVLTVAAITAECPEMARALKADQFLDKHVDLLLWDEMVGPPKPGTYPQPLAQYHVRVAPAGSTGGRLALSATPRNDHMRSYLITADRKVHGTAEARAASVSDPLVEPCELVPNSACPAELLPR